jgi:DNA-binding NarL/FixJ family response regulator
MSVKKKVIIVDDHDMFRAGVKVLLNNTKTIEVVSEARNGKEFLEILEKHEPDAVLMDISMPVMDGIEATRQGLIIKPNLKVLALSMYGDEEYYFKMVRAGVKGFVLKSSGISELEKAIIEVSNNGNYFSNELLLQIISNFSEQNQKLDSNKNATTLLTKREMEVLKLIVTGLSNSEIANKLNVSITTIKSHRSNLLNKTMCNNSASLIMYAIKNKIVEIN